MMHPYIQAAVAQERRKTMLADAEAARLARQARRTGQARPSAGRRSLGGRLAAWLPPARRRLAEGPEC
jgi:hypothetical protein